jgi:GDPmannose 4,6-dehydratase
LEAIRESQVKDIKFYQASSSEMFGKMVDNPSHENSPFYPRSPYGVAKVFGHWITKNYRESYGMFNCSGILFNHESERRGLEFVTRKITNGVARIHLGLSDNIQLGNINAVRDWGYAPDYVEAMWLMLQQNSPDDYIVATGESHTIKEFLDLAFAVVGLNWEQHIELDPKFMRPADVDVLRGDYSKAKENLGWKPKTPLHEIVKRMVLNDIKLLSEIK